MNKRRRPSTDRNPGARVPPRRSSNVSIRNASENPKGPSVQDPQKSSPSVQVDGAASRGEDRLANEDQRAPKTRFNPQDGQRKLRSNSSPRLKSFPAEVIKAACPQPLSSKPIAALIAQQDPQQNGAYLVPDQNQNGYTDQLSQLYRRQVMQQNHAVNMGQQQVPLDLASQMTPQPEGAMNQQGIDKQVCRSYVPNVPHGMAVREQTPRLRGGASALPSQSHPSSNHNPYVQRQPTIELMEESKRGKTTNVQEEWVVEETGTTSTHERQPVGGRNAVAHRRIMMQEKQQPEVPQQSQMMQPQETLATNSMPIVSQMPNAMSGQVPICQSNVQHAHPANVNPQAYPDSQNPQQVYMQLQHNIARQQQMQQRALSQQASMMNNQNQGPQYYGSRYPAVQSSAMTSPQDVSINQLKDSANRRMTDPNQLQQNPSYAISPQNGWIQNNRVIADHPSIRAQLKPFSVDLVNNNNNNNSNNNNQRQVQYQQYQHPQQQPNIQSERQYTPSNQYIQPPNGNQPMYSMNQQAGGNPIPRQQVPANVQQQQVRAKPDKKKTSQFTPAMLHDQEFLVATMRQQGISDELMRRQFDALLNEQRRQLSYIERYPQPDRKTEPGKITEPVVKKKSKVEEKPEWMIHLTPPRISYDDLERVRQRKHASADRSIQEQRATDEAQLKEYNNAQQQQMAMQQKMTEVPSNNQQSVHPQRAQPQSQLNAYQLWQQRTANWQQRTGLAPPAYGYTNMQQKMQPNMNGRSFSTTALPSTMQPHAYTQQQMMQQYQSQPQYQMYNPHNPQYQMQQYQQGWANAQAPIDATGNSKPLNNPSQPYDERGRLSVPSSLLKLKVYQDFIRPQKRNNGLQDPETVEKALESLKSFEGKAGYEYLGNLKRVGRVAKLNGTQDPAEMTAEMQSRYLLDAAAPPQRKIPSNGLENTRQPNSGPTHIAPQRRHVEENIELHEYPRQRQNNPRNPYSVMAEKEDGTVAVQQSPRLHQAHILQPMPTDNQMHPTHNPMAVLNTSTPPRFESSQPQYQQQVQHYQRNRQYLNNDNNGQGDIGSAQKSDLAGTINANRAGGDTAENPNDVSRQSAQQGKANPVAAPNIDSSRMITSGNCTQPEICEARTIGGVTFLARKPEYAPPNQLALQDAISSKYVQPLATH